MGIKELLDETGVPYHFVSEEEMEEEKKLRQKKATKKYYQSEKGKEAMKKANKKWSRTENGKIYYRNLARRQWRKRALFVKRVKLRYGCGICGYKKCTTSLHFDHIDPTTKKNVVSKLV